MRRVQGRPQSPWKMGLDLFVPYDKLIPLKKDLIEHQGGFAVAPLTPSQSSFLKGHCSETLSFNTHHYYWLCTRRVQGRPQSPWKMGLNCLFHTTSLLSNKEISLCGASRGFPVAPAPFGAFFLLKELTSASFCWGVHSLKRCMRRVQGRGLRPVTAKPSGIGSKTPLFHTTSLLLQ